MSTIKNKIARPSIAKNRKFPQEAYAFEDDVTEEGVDKVRRKAAPYIEAEEWELVDGFDRLIPRWVETPPALFDIVTCYYPERDPEPDGTPKLRPALVTGVWKGKASSTYLVEVCYGTKHLKLSFRNQLDLVIQNAADLAILGLPVATRFDLDNRAHLPWLPDFFMPWKGFASPRLSGLTEDYQKEYAYCMMQRLRSDGER